MVNMKRTDLAFYIRTLGCLRYADDFSEYVEGDRYEIIDNIARKHADAKTKKELIEYATFFIERCDDVYTEYDLKEENYSSVSELLSNIGYLMIFNDISQELWDDVYDCTLCMVFNVMHNTLGYDILTEDELFEVEETVKRKIDETDYQEEVLQAALEAIGVYVWPKELCEK